MRRFFVVSVFMPLILIGCGQGNRPAPTQAPVSQFRQIVVENRLPPEIIPNVPTPITVKATNLDQVKIVGAPPTGSNGSGLQYNNGQLTFTLTVPETPAGLITLDFRNDQGVSIPTNTPVTIRVANPTERALIEFKSTATEIRDQVNGLVGQMKGFQGELEEFRRVEGRVRAVEGSLATNTAEIKEVRGQVASAISETSQVQGQVVQLSERVTANENLVNERSKIWQQGQEELASRVTQLSTELATERAENNKLRAELVTVTKLNQQVIFDNGVLVRAVEHMGKRKVGGFVGIGQKTQLPEDMLIQIRSRMTARPSTSFEVVPARP